MIGLRDRLPIFLKNRGERICVAKIPRELDSFANLPRVGRCGVAAEIDHVFQNA